MNGICGIVSEDRREGVRESDLAKMCGALAMQPDDRTFFRLLPMANLGCLLSDHQMGGIAVKRVGDHSVAIALDGDVFNIAEIQSLVPETSPSPLHTLLSFYLTRGSEFLEYLRGEYALALWDGRHETLYLATDRFRTRPLFYYHSDKQFVFGSRMKAILASPFPIPMTIEPRSIIDVMAFSAITTPRTIFREVKKLPPGHVLSYCRGNTVVRSYWDINYLDPLDWDEPELARDLRRRLAEAITVRLDRDSGFGPIGTFLSGGVDSTTVTCLLRHLAKDPVKSFSIGFAEERFNEINYARIAAHAAEVEHYEYFVSSDDTRGIIPLLIDTFDEPYANASAVPTYFCAKTAKEQGVGVLYAGDGGDELFAGNERYASQRLFDYYSRIPRWMRIALVEPLVNILAGCTAWELIVKAKKYIHRASIPYPDRLFSYGVFRVIPVNELLEKDFRDAVGQDYEPYSPAIHHYFQARAECELDRQLYLDLKLAIADNDLIKVSRMTQAAGIMPRFPFLDHPLAEYSAKIPAGVRMPGRQLRAFFKRAYADVLPREIRAKTKHGFGLPIPIWLRTDTSLNEMMHELVLSPSSVQRGYFRKQTLQRVIELHKTDQTSFYGTILWNLMMLELWHRRHVDASASI